MSKFNNDVEKARKIVEEFKECNIGTIERSLPRDPLKKMWVFERVKTDPNAFDFKKKVIKTEVQNRKENASKSYARKYSSKEGEEEKKECKIKKKAKNKIKRQSLVQKSLAEQKIIIKPPPKARPKQILPNHETLYYTMYQLYSKGMRSVDIAAKLGTKPSYVRTAIYKYKRKFGDTLESAKRIGNYDKDLILKLRKEGLNYNQIGKKTNVSRSTIRNFLIKNHAN